MARRRGTAEAGGRVCMAEGCVRRVRAGEAFCQGCGWSAEAVAFRKELRGVADYLAGMAVPDPVRAEEAMARLGRRAGRGEFDRVGEARRRAETERAAAKAEVAKRVAAAHAAMARALTEEVDVSRMAAAMVRGAREAARARGTTT